MRNPFSKPEAVARHLKIAVTGKSGKGKTVFGLAAREHGFGKVAVISNEGGDVHYIKHPQWGGFDRLATSSIAEVDEALVYLESNPGVYGALVIDTVTGFYEALVSAMAKADGSVSVKNWGLIKRKWRSIMARLNNLPCSIIEVVHENDITETDDKTGKVSVVGQKLDAEKTFERNPDVLIRLGEHEGKRIGIVLKDRTGTFQAGQRVPDPNVGMWLGAIKAGTAEARVAPLEEVDAANEAAMSRPVAQPPATTTAHPTAAPEATAEQIAKAAELAGVCAAGFNASAHWKNWGLKHAEEIKALPEWLRARVKSAYKAAPIKTTQQEPPIEAAGGVQ